MAEEKKTGKKFCTKCGKPLKEGEVCDCQKEKKEVKKEVVKETPKKVEQPKVVSQPVNNQVNQPVYNNVVMQQVPQQESEFTVFMKNIWKDIIDVIKNPMTVIRKKYEEKSMMSTMLLLVLIAISSGILGCGLCYGSLKAGVEYDVSIPYIQFLLFFGIMGFIFMFLPICAAFITSKLPKFSTNTVGFKDIMNIYATSNSPMVYINAVLGILLMFGLSEDVYTAILFVVVACIICCFYNFIVAYNEIVNPDEDRKTYGVTLISIITIVFIWVVFKLFGDTLNDTFAGICEDIEFAGVAVGENSKGFIDFIASLVSHLISVFFTI